MPDDTRQQNNNQSNGFINRVVQGVKNTYTNVDRTVGGYLPAGVTPQQVQQSKQSNNQSSNKLNQVITPPKNALTDALNKSASSSGTKKQTYNTSTGVYTNSSGQGYSTTSSPTGETYTGGGTIDLGKGQSVTSQSVQNKSINNQLSTKDKVSLAVWGDTGYIGSNGVIDVYQRNQLPFLTKYQAGAEGGFISRLKDWWNTGEFPIGKDVKETIYIPTRNQGGTRTDIGIGFNGIFVSPTPDKQTIRQRNVNEFMILDVGTPTEFKLQDLNKETEKQYKKQYETILGSAKEQADTYATKLQGQINTGSLTVPQAEVAYESYANTKKRELELRGEELSGQFKESFNLKANELISKDLSSKEYYSKQTKESRVDLVPIVETAAFIVAPEIGAGLATSGIGIGSVSSIAGESTLIKGSIESLPRIAKIGSITGEAIATGTLGFKDIVQGAYRGDIMQIGTGALFTGFGAGSITSKTFKEGLQLAGTEYAFEGLSKQSFKYGEGSTPLLELRSVGVTDTSKVLGKRSFGNFDQVVFSQGDIIKQGEQFIMPSGELKTITTGTLKGSNIQFGEEVGSKAFVNLKSFDIGTKGITLPISEEISFTLGSGTLIPKFESTAFSNVKELNEPLVNLYHGTSSEYLGSIYEKGLIGKNNKVFATDIKLDAEGYAASKVYSGVYKEGSKPQLLEISMPKSIYEKNLFYEGLGRSGKKEIILSEIEPKFIKGSESFGSFKFSFDSADIAKQLKSNVKYFEGKEFSKTGITGVTKQLKEDLFVSRIGNIKSIGFDEPVNLGTFSVQREGLKIDAELKDFVLTKKIPKNELKTFEVFETRGSDLGLKQFKEIKQPKVQSELVQQGLINEFKSEFKPSIPKMNLGLETKQTSRNAFKGFGVFSGTEQTTKTKQKDIFGTNLYPRSFNALGNLSISNNAFKSMSPVSLATPSASSFKTDFSFVNPSLTKQTFQPSSNFFNNTFTGFDFGGFPSSSGFSGFGFLPPLQLGGDIIGGSRRKVKKRKKQKIRPSFTAEVFNIRGSLPKQTSLGTNPFQIRAIPKSFKNPLKINF